MNYILFPTFIWRNNRSATPLCVAVKCIKAFHSSIQKKLIYNTIISLLLLFGIAHAQVSTPRLQQDRISLGGITFETWKAESDRISQFSLPITYIYPISEKTRLNLITSPAFSSLSAGESNSLVGLSDTRISGHHLFGGDRYLFTFGLSLPTGKNALSTEEFNVSNALSIHALGFRVPSMGQGTSINLGIATARQYGDYVLGGGINYINKDHFKPFKDFEYVYDPGDELSLSVGVDREITLMRKDIRLMSDMVYTMYASDEANDEKTFKSGNKLLIQLVSRTTLQKIDLSIYIRERFKGKNKTGVGDLFEQERKNSNGNEFEILGQGIYPYSDRTQLLGLLDLKFYGNNEYETGGATLFGFGGGGMYRYSDQIVFDGSLRLYFGSIQSTVESTGVFGIKLAGGIKYYFR